MDDNVIMYIKYKNVISNRLVLVEISYSKTYMGSTYKLQDHSNLIVPSSAANALLVSTTHHVSLHVTEIHRLSVFFFFFVRSQFTVRV